MKTGNRVRILSRQEVDKLGTITRVNWRGAAGSCSSFIYRVHVELDDGSQLECDPHQLEVIDD